MVQVIYPPPSPELCGRAVQPSAPPMEAIAQSNTTLAHGVTNSDNVAFSCANDETLVIERHKLNDIPSLAKVICGASQVPFVNGKYVYHDVSKTLFLKVINYCQSKRIDFQSVEEMISILLLAKRFEIDSLICDTCIAIDNAMNADNVLKIYSAVWWFHQGFHDSKNLERVSSGKTSISTRPVTADDYCSALGKNLLQFIEMNFTNVCGQQEITMLGFQALEKIAKMEKLQMPNEGFLYNMLLEWSAAECDRRQLLKSEQNRRTVLGSLCYTVRYLTMKKQEFLSITRGIQLLSVDETKLVVDAYDKKQSSSITKEQLEMLTKFAQRRPRFARMPIHLSDRSNHSNYPYEMRKENEDIYLTCWDAFLYRFCCVFSKIVD